ncbi:MFS transporter [Thermopirellula anaerolimosa]
MMKSRREDAATRRIPLAIWVLGFVSLCMDVSSEMIHALLPVFLISTLGAGTIALGMIEGVAEAVASITKVFSGVISDRMGRRKPLAVMGYGLAAVSKPLFPLAASPLWVFVARFVDRIGKGMRGAPRDALVADCSPPEVRGAAYGLRQALDTLGALLGPLAALALMAALANDIRAVFWVATFPAVAAVVLLIVGVKEPARDDADAKAPRRLPRWSDVKSLGGRFWGVLLIGAAMALARFSEAFLVLRAYDAGLATAWTPLAFVVMNLTYSVSAYPAGRLSDSWGRTRLLTTGLIVLIGADLVLAADLPIAMILVGIALWGLHMGLTQGLLAALVADSVPDSLRGSGFGVFYFVSGVTALAASLLAGALWKWVGPAGTFLASAVFSAIAIIGLPLGTARK